MKVKEEKELQQSRAKMVKMVNRKPSDLAIRCEIKIIQLEKDMKFIKYLLIYIAGAMSINFGNDIFPLISALIS